MRTATKLAEDYIALWNETEQARRLELLAATWTCDATYTDPLVRASGHSQMDGVIGAVQARFPAFRFALAARSADSFGDHVRFSWALGPHGGDAVIKGTDFVMRDGDRIKSVVGFLDQAPSGAA